MKRRRGIPGNQTWVDNRPMRHQELRQLTGQSLDPGAQSDPAPQDPEELLERELQALEAWGHRR